MDTRNVDWVSHKDYLDSCTLDDLYNLKGFLEDRIEDIKKEDKTEIFGVMGPSYMEGWFKTYPEAYQCFVDKVVPKLKKKFHCDDKVGITHKRVFESELKEYLE